jgi:hypothetical protein
MGSIPSGPTRGHWEGDSLTFQDRTPQGFTRYLYRFEANGRYTFRLENSPDGEQWTPFIEATYRRS